MITFDDFKKKYKISEDEFEASGISWDELRRIHEDYGRKIDYFGEMLEQFIDEFLSPSRIRERGLRVHSIGSRVKDPEHLI